MTDGVCKTLPRATALMNFCCMFQDMSGQLLSVHLEMVRNRGKAPGSFTPKADAVEGSEACQAADIKAFAKCTSICIKHTVAFDLDAFVPTPLLFSRILKFVVHDGC